MQTSAAEMLELITVCLRSIMYSREISFEINILNNILFIKDLISKPLCI